MAAKHPCPICEAPMRSDHVVKHLYKHRDALKEVMTPTAIAWCVAEKVPYLYKMNAEKPGKSYGICLICREGRAERSALGNWAEWSKLHRRRSKPCMERFDEVEHLYTD